MPPASHSIIGMKSPFLLTLLAFVVIAQAEPPPTTSPINWEGYGITLECTFFPFSQEVDYDMQLTPAQSDAVRKYTDRYARYSTVEGLLQGFKDDRAGIFTHLNDQQKLRFDQLTHQYRGALTSFLIAANAKELDLSPMQTERLRTLYEIYLQGLPNIDAYQKLTSGQKESSKAQGQLKEAANRLAESVLTPDQLRKWNEMQGPPFYPRPFYW